MDLYREFLNIWNRWHNLVSIASELRGRGRINIEELKELRGEVIFLQRELNNFVHKYRDDLIRAAILGDFQRLIDKSRRISSRLSYYIYNFSNNKNSKNESIDIRNILNMLEEIDGSFSTINRKLIGKEYRINAFRGMSTPRIEVNNQVSRGYKENAKNVVSNSPKPIKKEEEKQNRTPNDGRSMKDKVLRMIKEKGRKGKSYLRNLAIPPFVTFLALALYEIYFYNAIYFITFGILAVLFYSLYTGRASSFFIPVILVIVIGGILYVYTSTPFRQYICLATGYCGPSPSTNSASAINQIKESIMETIQNMRRIMTNPESYYIEQQAESEAAPEAYKYMFDISYPYSIPPIYFTVPNAKSSEIKDLNIPGSSPIIYSVRSSLPLNSSDIGLKAYCIVIPKFNISCIESGFNGKNWNEYYGSDKAVIGYYKILAKNEILPKYGLQNFFCQIPPLTLNVKECEDLLYSTFDIDTKFLLQLTNVSTTTYYKFLVVDENLIAQAVLKKEDVYEYLHLNSYEYDKGYFVGFIDFPKINILRLGVLSKYPVVIFNNSGKRETEDVLYISLSDIKEVYNISKIRIDLLYDPSEVSIWIDQNYLENLKNSNYFYNINCGSNNKGRIECNITFKSGKSSVFGENPYIMAYKEQYNRMVFFIPIHIAATKNFTEYTEVLVKAMAVYGIEKSVEIPIEYHPLEISQS